ncbi:MAG: response regulator [Deltaproteobacteria bacterium]|nr:MAG: response regulator [Deltaproteobacteria bacterium]
MTPKKILVVDDTPDIVHFLVVRLRSEGFDTLTAYNGLDGLSIAERDRPDLIILDVMMPQLNGFQVCRKLKENPELSHIPVLFLTAKDQPSDRFWGEEVGASAYLTKPVDPRMVAQTVHELLGTE